MYTVTLESEGNTTKTWTFDSYDEADKKLERLEKIERKHKSVIIAEPELFYAVTPWGYWRKYEIIY